MEFSQISERHKMDTLKYLQKFSKTIEDKDKWTLSLSVQILYGRKVIDHLPSM